MGLEQYGPDFEQILIRAIDRDIKAFESLVRILHKRLWYYINRIVDDLDRAEDVLQQVWITVYEQLPTLQSTKAFPVWIYKIARNLAYHEVRRQTKYVEIIQAASDFYDETIEDDGLQFELDETELINRALEQLTPEHREVIMLKFFYDMSYQELSEVTGCNLGTIRSRLFYAKKEMAKKMEELRNGR